MSNTSNPPFFPAYYDHLRNRYLVESTHGWMRLCKEDLLLHMENDGWDKHRKKGSISDLESMFLRVQLHNKIDYAGPVAGHRKGLVTMGGSRVLVTDSYRPLVPVQGSWTNLEAFLRLLFDRASPLQLPIFYSWCKIFLQSLSDNVFIPGQALVLAGPHQSGKSFLQNRLTILFGGRSANPWPYMSGATEFNSELYGAEHLQAEDPAVNRLCDRLDFANRIKQFTVNEIQPCHGKSKDIVTLQPRWRLTISINDESYNLRAIPPLDDSTSDKFIILQCSQNSTPGHNGDMSLRESYRVLIDSELPAFAYFLLNEWEIPASLRGDRFGVIHYHHAPLVEEINSQSPEFEILTVMDEAPGYFFNDAGAWVGTAKDLSKLFKQLDSDPQAQRLSKNDRIFQNFLGTLSRKYPDRVVKKKGTNGIRLWIIYKNIPAEG